MSDPAAANKLLAMLRAGGSGSGSQSGGSNGSVGAVGPSPSPSAGMGASAASSTGANGSYGMKGPSGDGHQYAYPFTSPPAAPARPSALSPSPAGRAVSLNDLFASMGQPQLASPSLVGGVLSPPPSSNGRAFASPGSGMGARADQSGHDLGHGQGNGVNGSAAFGTNTNSSAGHLLGMLKGDSSTGSAPAPPAPANPWQPWQGAQYTQYQSPSAASQPQAPAQAPSPVRSIASPPATNASQAHSGTVDLLGLLKKVQSRSTSGVKPSANASVDLPSIVSPPPVPAKPAASIVATDVPVDKEQAAEEEVRNPFSNENAVKPEEASFDGAEHVTTEVDAEEAAEDEDIGDHGELKDLKEAVTTENATAGAGASEAAQATTEGEETVDSGLIGLPSTPAPATTGTPSTSESALPKPSPAPVKTIFDFVSPFDMFVKPKTSTPTPVTALSPAPASVAPISQSAEKAASAVKVPADVKQEKVASKAMPTPRKASATAVSTRQSAQQPANAEVITPASEASPVAILPKANQASVTSKPDISAESASSDPSESVLPSKKSKVAPDLDKTLQVERVINGQSGSGPATPSAHITFDLSQPNLSSLINDKQAVQVIPTTIVKASDTSFRNGRMQGMTEGLLAYGLSKGKIRLIDRATGSRLVITLGGSASSGQIIDMAVTPTLLAVVGADHSVSAYRIPRSWSSDDPACDRIVQLHGTSNEIGAPFKVEWVRKGAEHLLAIGGSNGVVLVDPAHVGKRLDDLVRKHKVLFTEGDMVDFCLNQTHQAIGLLSSTSVFSLYSLATLSRVWHRPFPTQSATDSTPSSVTFCESNLLVGRDRNTHFDLVQITTDLAVLGSVTLLAPPPCPVEHHYAHAIYDAAHQNIWIAPFARGSLIGLRYTLKGQAPIRVSQGESKAPWDLLGEVHSPGLEPIVSLVSSAGSEGQDLEIFYGHNKGFSMATVQGDIPAQAEESSSLEVSAPSQPRVADPEQKQTLQEEVSSQPPAESVEVLAASQGDSSVRPTVPTPAAPATPKQQQQEGLVPEPAVTSTPMSRRASKASASAKSPAAQAPVSLPQGVNHTSPQKQTVGPNIAASGISEKSLKKMEDRIITQTRQAVSSSADKLAAKYDAVSVDRLAGDITAKVDKMVSGMLVNTIRDEVKKTASAAIQHEIRQAVPAAIVTSARQVLPAELEREMGSLLHHILPGAVQAAVDRSVQSALQKIVMPDMAKMIGNVTDEVIDQVREEILQIKKDMSPPPEPTSAVDLTAITETLIDMQKQIAALSEQLAQHNAAPPPQPPAPSTRPPPAVDVPSSHPSGQVPPPLPAQTRPVVPPQIQAPAMQLPSTKDLEDAFLTSLSQSSTASTVQLVTEYYHLTEYCLPIPGRPPHGTPHAGHVSPLSAAVKITLLHRLSLALADLRLNDPAFTKCLDWEERVAILVDPAEQETSAFYPRVKEMVMSQMGLLLQKMQREGLGASGVAYAVRGLMDGLARKG